MLASWQTEVNSKNKLQGYTKGKSKKIKNSYKTVILKEGALVKLKVISKEI